MPPSHPEPQAGGAWEAFGPAGAVAASLGGVKPGRVCAGLIVFQTYALNLPV